MQGTVADLVVLILDDVIEAACLACTGKLWSALKYSSKVLLGSTRADGMRAPLRRKTKPTWDAHATLET